MLRNAEWRCIDYRNKEGEECSSADRVLTARGPGFDPQPEALGLIPSPALISHRVHTYNPSTWGLEVGKSEVQSHPELQILVFLIPCLNVLSLEVLVMRLWGHKCGHLMLALRAQIPGFIEKHSGVVGKEGIDTDDPVIYSCRVQPPLTILSGRGPGPAQ